MGNLYRDYNDALYKYCLTFLKQEALSRDAVQDVFLKVMLNFDGLISKDALTGWLFRIARNHCIDVIRQKRRDRAVALGSPSNPLSHPLSFQPEDSLVSEAVEMEKKVGERLSRLEQLASPDFEILLMKYREELTIKEIASGLKIKEGAVKMRIHRAKYRAQSLLKERT